MSDVIDFPYKSPTDEEILCFAIMSNYTSLGEWSDGEDDWIFEINEDEVLRRFNKINTEDGIDEWSDSEDDELIRNINEDEILRGVNDDLEHEQTRRGEKRHNVNLSDSEDEPTKKRKNQNVVSSDTDPIPNVSDEGTTEENEQTGQGKKRKAENQDVEQEDYYHIQPVKDYHSQKFNMTAKNYSVQFNNALDNVDLLQSQNRTYDIFDRLIRDVTQG